MLTVENTSFRPDQKIEITGEEFALFTVAMEHFFENMRMPAFPVRYKFIDKDGEPVEKPTEEDIEKENVVRVIDIHSTFNPDNAIEAYAGNISYPMLEAMRNRYEIHNREVEAGRAISVDELMKSRTEVVEE
jgi:hypothetical protein